MILGGIRIARNGDLGVTDDSLGDTVVVLAFSIIGLIIGGLLVGKAVGNARRERLEHEGLVSVTTASSLVESAVTADKGQH